MSPEIAAARGPTWAVVPLKSPATAKSRLAGVLSPRQRRQLFFLMARRMIEVLTQVPRIEQVAVVTASPHIGHLARGLGAIIIAEAQDAGTAAACRTAISWARAQGVMRLLMIAGDIPLVTPDAIDRLIDRGHSAPSIVIVPDRARVGTNALLCSPPDAVPVCFGEDSFARHLAAARCAGAALDIVDGSPLAFDVDGAADLALLRHSLRDGRLPRGLAALRTMVDCEDDVCAS
jgi:2-phospho-L-lactate guanylyltransferase